MANSGQAISVFPFSSKGKNMDHLMFVQDTEINAREDTVPGIHL